MSVEAANRIRDLTQDNGFWGTSRNGQMQEVRDLIAGQTPAEREATIALLSDADLQALADDVNAGGVFGASGLSRDEKRDLFNDLAKGLSGDQLARISSAFDDREDVVALGEAIATHGSSAVKVDFVQATASRSTDTPTETETHLLGLGGSSTRTGDPDAQAIGLVIGSLKGDAAAVDQAFAALSEPQLNAVVAASAGEVMHTSPSIGGSPGAAMPSISTSYNAAPLTALLDAAATGSDANQKARVFEAGASTLGDVRDSGSLLTPSLDKGETAEAVQASLTAILDSDTTGVIGQLEINDRNGGALSAYMAQTLSQDGGEAAVGDLVARMQQGNDLNQNPHDRMSELNANNAYDNAENLGYLSGAIQVGIKSNAADAKAQAEMLTSIFSQVIGLGASKAPPGVSQGINLLTKEVMTEIVDQYSSSGQLSAAMYELTFPTDPVNNQPYEGPAEPAYDSASSRVINAN